MKQLGCKILKHNYKWDWPVGRSAGYAAARAWHSSPFGLTAQHPFHLSLDLFLLFLSSNQHYLFGTVFFLKVLRSYVQGHTYLLYSVKIMLTPSGPPDRGSYADQFEQSKLVGASPKIKFQSHGYFLWWHVYVWEG